MTGIKAISILVGLLLLVAGCGRQVQGPTTDFSERKMRVVATTNIVGNLVREVAGDAVELTTLMGPGVDPHLYKASEGDVQRMAEADLLLYNGFHLEGRMTKVFEQMQQSQVPTVAVAERALPDSVLVGSDEYAGNYDPHVWFDVSLWAKVARETGEVLAERDTARADLYRRRARSYAADLDTLDHYVREQARRVPPARRVLITSHDAFSYFGRAYDFEVLGLQGISTETEAGAADVQRLARFVTERRIPAIFVETSVSQRGIEAVQEAVRANGYRVRVGGTLFGDALGDQETREGTYEGAVRHNIDTIVRGLLQEAT